jgi:hypothetical protein
VKSALREAEKRDITLDQSEVFSLASKIALQKNETPRVDPLRTTTLAWSRMGNFTPGSPTNEDKNILSHFKNRKSTIEDHHD